MKKDLTNSEIDRQNILNNPYALAEIEKAAGIQGIPFENKTVVLKEQVAAFFEVTVRTVVNYLESHPEELGRNGYEVLKGKRLKGKYSVRLGRKVWAGVILCGTRRIFPANKGSECRSPCHHWPIFPTR